MNKKIILCWMMLFALSSLFAKTTEFRLAIPYFPTKFVPYSNSETYSNLFIYNVFETLLDKQGDSYVPNIAESWVHPSPNCTRFFITKDHYFHNGKKVTAKDVKASIEYVLDSKNNYIFIDSLVLQSEYVLDVFSEQTDQIFQRIDNILVFDTETLDADNFVIDFRTAIGSGSHYITEYSENEIVFSKFLLHPKAENVVDKIKILRIPDKKKQTELFMQGKLDYLENPQPNFLKLYVPQKKFTTHRVFGHTILFLTFDAQKEKTKAGLQNPFAQKEVRKAIAKSIHIQDFLNQQLVDYAMPLNTFISPIIREFPEIEPIRYDIQYAEKILNQHLSKDVVYEFDCIKDKFTGDILMGRYIQKTLKNLGFQFRINDVSTETLYEHIKTESIPLYITGYSYMSDRIYPIFSYFFQENSLENVNGTFSYSDVFLKKNIALLKNTKNDTLRVEIEDRLMTYCMETYKVIPLYSPHHVVLINDEYKLENKKMLKFETLKK